MSETLDLLRKWRETLADSIRRLDSGETDNGIMSQIRAQQHDTLDKAILELEALRVQVATLEQTLFSRERDLESKERQLDDLHSSDLVLSRPLGAFPARPFPGASCASLGPDAHELWAAAQLVPGEGIEDGVARIEALLEGSRAR